MGIIIDLILLVILILSTYLGYKKGLVKLGAKLFAGIIAIIVIIIIYKPVSNIIIANTSINEKIEKTIIDNTTNFVNKNSEVPNIVTNKVTEDILPEEAKNISRNVIYAITSIILFVFIKIALSILISFMDSIANLPILKQFNEIGGIIYGMIRGIIVICICVLLMGVFTKINPENMLNSGISSSYLTKIIYINIVKF